MLMTANPKICREARKAFAFFGKNYTFETFNHLILSPFSSRKKITSLILNEIKNKEKGLEAYIHIKINNLVDIDTINLLLKASEAGVKINLLIRGMNSLKPDKYKNIKAFGIVDKYLEHSRIMIFANGGNPKVFISSSDLMTRNLDRRVEVICPIYDTDIKKTLIQFFNISFKDNVKARILNDTLTNDFRKRKANEKPYRSQFEMYEFIKNNYLPLQDHDNL
jgi:polyphosphate kinase